MTAPIRPGPIVPKPPILDGMPDGAFVFPPDTIIRRPKQPDIPDTPLAWGNDAARALYDQVREENPDLDLPPTGFDDDTYRVIRFPKTGHTVVARTIDDVTVAYTMTIAAEDAGGDAGTVDLGGAPLPANNGD